VPEISGHRLMVIGAHDARRREGRLRAAAVDTTFELSLCA
jgi:hypothetical protein